MTFPSQSAEYQRLYNKQYRLDNKEELERKSLAYRAANKEKKKAYDIVYRKQNAAKIATRLLVNRDKKNAATKEWRLSNPEKQKLACRNWQQANLDKAHAGAKKWRQNNLDRVNAIKAKRRAIKQQATPLWENMEAINVVYKKADKFGLHVDHIVSLNSKIVCGLHTWHNLQLLSSLENTIKGNRYWPDMPT